MLAKWQALSLVHGFHRAMLGHLLPFMGYCSGSQLSCWLSLLLFDPLSEGLGPC